MLLLWGLILWWGVLPQAQGEAQHPLNLRISKDELQTDISELFLEHKILNRITKIPVTGTSRDGVALLDHLPFVREGLSQKSNVLDLSFVGDLLSGSKLSLVKELIQAGGLVIEDAKGPTVALQILSNSLLQVTLRCKLYLSLQGILRLKIIKNIRIGVRLEQTGNKTEVAFEECHTPPGYLSITVLEEMNPPLVNPCLKLVTSILDEMLPFLLQKIVCPLATTLLNTMLEDLLHLTLSPTSLAPGDAFQYYVITTELTEEAILMKVQLVTPCSPQCVPRSVLLPSKPLPKLAQDSMADLVFWPNVYNNILCCLYTSETLRVDPHNSIAANLIQLLSLRDLQSEPKTSNQCRAKVELTISAPDPPTIHLDNHVATVTQLGSLVLWGPKNTSTSVSWKLHSEAVFSSRDQKLSIQFNPDSTMITLDSYPDDLVKQADYLKFYVSEILKSTFLAQHNDWLRKQALPLPNIKNISFNQARMVSSEGHLILTIPKQ